MTANSAVAAGRLLCSSSRAIHEHVSHRLSRQYVTRCGIVGCEPTTGYRRLSGNAHSPCIAEGRERRHALQYPLFKTAEARASLMAEAGRDRLSAKTGRQRITEGQTVWPSREALHLATAAIRRGYILPETTQHPVVQFECANLALLIMAWGLAPTDAACRVAPESADTQPASPTAR